jgi:hypothetical protein
MRGPNPHLAAYAFKCFIRLDPVFPGEVPPEVWSRTEEVGAVRRGGWVEALPLGRYVGDYFQSDEYLLRNPNMLRG